MNLSMKALLVLCCGGALGTWFRYLLCKLIGISHGTGFPWGTFSVNVLGCLLIGLVFGLVERFRLGPIWTLAWATGFCGGFTTFSTFVFENKLLFENGQYYTAFLYASGSYIVGFGATALGMALTKIGSL